MLTAVHFRVGSPGLFHVPTLLLEDIAHVKPALQMAAAKLAFGIFFVTGALSQFLDFDLMIR